MPASIGIRAAGSSSAIGTFVSRRDDSTFLSTQNSGTRCCCPIGTSIRLTRKSICTRSYQIAKHLSAYGSVQNVLNQNYQEVYGYPALPFTVRAGMKFTFGGESWKLK